MELMTGFGLATAAGLNAYIPMLLMGLLSKFTSLITLPSGWTWLEMATGHEPMVTEPEALARMLLGVDS